MGVDGSTDICPLRRGPLKVARYTERSAMLSFSLSHGQCDIVILLMNFDFSGPCLAPLEAVTAPSVPWTFFNSSYRILSPFLGSSLDLEVYCSTVLIYDISASRLSAGVIGVEFRTVKEGSRAMNVDRSLATSPDIIDKGSDPPAAGTEAESENLSDMSEPPVQVRRLSMDDQREILEALRTRCGIRNGVKVGDSRGMEASGVSDKSRVSSLEVSYSPICLNLRYSGVLG